MPLSRFTRAAGRRRRHALACTAALSLGAWFATAQSAADPVQPGAGPQDVPLFVE